jgi:uncharacterized protein YjbI with pentapeptide repeats
MKVYNPMTPDEFFEAYKNGQRHFIDLDFEYVDGFANKDFSNIIFEGCFLYLDFRESNLTNAQFIGCNIKEIDLRGCNLTNAYMTNCLVESATFKSAITGGFRFIDNYFYGSTIGQEDFNKTLIHQDSYILGLELSNEKFKKTMGSKMKDVTLTAMPAIDIWPYYVTNLVYEGIVPQYVLDKELVEAVYRNDAASFEHVLLPTGNANKIVVIVIDLLNKKIEGYYRLDLEKEYGIAYVV